MHATKRMRVRVDSGRCQGHNRCKALAPELFELDDDGNARATGDGTVPPGVEEKAWLAKANCPETAVEVLEDCPASEVQTCDQGSISRAIGR